MENKEKIENKMDVSELVDGRGIYAIKHMASSKVYIGQSKHIKKRIAEHCNSLRKGKHINPKLQNAINKYGESAFTVITLEINNNDVNLFPREDYWATQFNAFDEGYNIAPIDKNTAIWDYDQYKNSKLTKSDVIDICHSLNNGESAIDIAPRFGVKPLTIHSIRRGDTWGVLSKSILRPDVSCYKKRLIKNEVLQVCKLMNEGMSQKEISLRFNLNAATIQNIKSGKLHSKITKGVLKNDISYITSRKLTKDDVVEIVHLINQNEASINQIALRYGVSCSTIESIKHGKIWKDVTQPILKLKKPVYTPDERIIAVCRSINEGIPIAKITKMYNMHFNTIKAIKSGKKRPDLTKDILNPNSKCNLNQLLKDEVMEIVHLLNQKELSNSEIARLYGVHKSTIENIKFGRTWSDVTKSILSVEKNVIKHFTKEETIDVFTMIEQGVSVKKIAEKYDVSYDKIYRIRKIGKNKILKTFTSNQDNSDKIKKLSDEEIIAICHLINDGISVKTISEKHRVSTKTIYKIKKGHTREELTKNILNQTA